MLYLQWSFWIVGLALHYLLLTSLLTEGRYKSYLAIFIYSICLVVTTFTDIFFVLDIGQVNQAYRWYYFIADLLRQSALYCVVISLVMHAMPQDRRRAALVRLLILLAFLFWSGTLFAFQDARISSWMTKVVRNLSFCTAIVNLALWFILIASEKKDALLLTITGGLGLQITGEAIGQSLRQISKSTELAGNILLVLAHFLCLYIWWHAFDRSAVTASRPLTRSASGEYTD